jgi:hypothetical protein
VSAIVGAVGTVVGSIVGAMAAVRSIIGPFVEAFDPSIMKRFALVSADLMASIGEQLVPIMRVANVIFRAVADTIAGMTSTVLPFVRRFADAVGRFSEAIVDGVRDILASGAVDAVFELLTAVLEDLTDVAVALIPSAVAIVKVLLLFVQVAAEVGTAMLEMIPIKSLVVASLEQMGRTLMWLAGKMRDWIDYVRSLVGLDPLGGGRGGMPSNGKSSQPANFTTSEDVWKNAMLSAFASKSESEAKAAPARSAKYLEIIAGFFERNSELMQRWLERGLKAEVAVGGAVADPMATILALMQDHWAARMLKRY